MKFWDQFDEYASHSLRYVKRIRENKGPSLGKIQVKIPHQRSAYIVKFEDRSQGKTARQERCAAKNIYKLKEKTEVHSIFPRRNGYYGLRPP